ncbi:MAG: hypothetical protein OMM_10271 [Candidatus Magnetoglobus multicellularis str. Araruama]|uniref:DNA circulation N-terminal domain-containing protein n=1 Tax=Candidatus Magnetoglobus multicellularis str. Araruama TaxID=890399 RepID=A0A1V1P1J2_9BACT|nr:MAG: hypothetical protein OMM_10271 [Candidatus Magnetoglobus multicellularis str. Araruama]
MAWQDRLKDTIILTSPDGNEFEALWKSSTTTRAKKLGIFNYPEVDGEIVQDLGVGSERVSFDVIFDGEDHDKIKDQFNTSLSERGLWTIDHPVNGIDLYQLIDYSFSDDPIENGNSTIFL